MDKLDAEKEDAGIHDQCSGINVEDSEEKLTVSMFENEKETSLAINDTRDPNKSSTGSECMDKMGDDAEDGKTAETELGNQTSTERLNVEGGKSEHVDDESQHTAKSRPIDAESGVLEENVVNDGGENNSDKIMLDENPIGDVASEKVTDGEAKAADMEMVIENFGSEDPKTLQNDVSDEDPHDKSERVDNVAIVNGCDEPKEQGEKVVVASAAIGEKAKAAGTGIKQESDSSLAVHERDPITPSSIVRYAPAKGEDHSAETAKTVYTQSASPVRAVDYDGSTEEQAAFMNEVESFYRVRGMDFKPPKFYGQPLNCLKLWRSVIRLGGYDRVTGAKLWRQVGELFHPPKTCTTVSWTFRIFYEKSLLEYERHKRQGGDLELPSPTLPEAPSTESEGPSLQGSAAGSGRARRDAAARAMQGWHAQRLSADGEVGEPIIKEKNQNNTATKRERNVKSISTMKQKRSSEVEQPVKSARVEESRQLETSVVDIGPPADWVKINVRQNKDCFEVYALIPGLLREEVRVQSDPAGRLVITGQPEQVDNPWGITPFKKVVSLPARIDPMHTSAVVSVHGRLYVRLPFEHQSN